MCTSRCVVTSFGPLASADARGTDKLGKREWYKFWEWGIWTWTWPRQKYTLYICRAFSSPSREGIRSSSRSAAGIKFDEPSKTVCVSPKHQTRCGEWIGAFTVERQPVFLEWQIVGVCPELKRDMIFESPSKPPKYQTRTRKSVRPPFAASTWS